MIPADVLKKLPRRIPADFVPRVLSKLLPDQDVIRRLPPSAILKLNEKRKELEDIINADPTRFFEPIPGGQREFMTCWDKDDSKIVLCMFAGNKTGKTTAGAILLGERLLGRPLWDRGRRSVRWTKVPCRAAVFAEDFESHNETIVPTLYSWLPQGTIRRIHKNSAGAIVETEFHNGSIIHHKTFQQGPGPAEGKDWDIVWIDEPPPADLYGAVFRGLVATGGKMLITATLLREGWLYDELSKPFVASFEADIMSNPWLDVATRDAFLNSLSDEEREARRTGRPLSLTGAIYKTFKDGPPFVVDSIDPKDIPTEWPIVVGVDPHERRPVCVEYCFVTPNDEILWFDYLLLEGGAKAVIDQMLEYENEVIGRRPACMILDPNRGKAVQKDGSSWEEDFSTHGDYTVILGKDSLSIGHAKMYDYLTIDQRTGRPRMMWTAKCRGPGGPIFQMLRYSWEDWHRRVTKSKKEKPRDIYKDFPDIHRYVAMEEFTFDSLVAAPYVPYNIRPYGRIGGVYV